MKTASKTKLYEIFEYGLINAEPYIHCGLTISDLEDSIDECLENWKKYFPKCRRLDNLYIYKIESLAESRDDFEKLMDDIIMTLDTKLGLLTL